MKILREITPFKNDVNKILRYCVDTDDVLDETAEDDLDRYQGYKIQKVGTSEIYESTEDYINTWRASHNLPEFSYTMTDEKIERLNEN